MNNVNTNPVITVYADEVKPGQLLNGWDKVSTVAVRNGTVWIYTLTDIWRFSPTEPVKIAA